MTARYTIKPRADRDLDEYGDRLAREASLDVALRFFDAAQRTFTLLAAQPNMGCVHGSITPVSKRFA